MDRDRSENRQRQFFQISERRLSDKADKTFFIKVIYLIKYPPYTPYTINSYTTNVSRIHYHTAQKLTAEVVFNGHKLKEKVIFSKYSSNRETLGHTAQKITAKVIINGDFKRKKYVANFRRKSINRLKTR